MNPTLHFVTLLLSLTWAAPASAAPITISEVLYDALGSDNGKVFVELYGPPGTSLDDYSLEGVNGTDGSLTTHLTLSGSIPADGFFVVADADAGVTAVPDADLILDFDFQNGPDSIVLRGPGGGLLDALGYGVFEPGEVFAGEGSAAPDPPTGQSLARRLANVDSGDNLADFEALETPTPGTGPVQLPEPRAVLLVGACLAGLAGARPRRRTL